MTIITRMIIIIIMTIITILMILMIIRKHTNENFLMKGLVNREIGIQCYSEQTD